MAYIISTRTPELQGFFQDQKLVVPLEIYPQGVVQFLHKLGIALQGIEASKPTMKSSDTSCD
jgi:hypothetical protein